MSLKVFGFSNVMSYYWLLYEKLTSFTVFVLPNTRDIRGQINIYNVCTS